MRMGTLEGKVKEIEIQPELKPGSSECRLALLQVSTAASSRSQNVLRQI